MKSRFPNTAWGTIEAAKGGSNRAMNYLLTTYLPAVRGWARSRGFQDSDAEDIAQEVGTALFGGKLLERVDREKGRFRSLVLGIARHVISKRLRSSRSQASGIVGPKRDSVSSFDVNELLAAPVHDESFDSEWTKAVITRSLDSLEKKKGSRRAQERALLFAHFVEGRTCRDLSLENGMTETGLRTVLHRAAKRLQDIVFATIRCYCSSDEEFLSETEQFRKRLSTRQP